MTPPGDEAVVAYIDGTMDDEALALFEARLAEDPALAEHVAAHRRVTQQIVAAYGAPHDADTGVDASLIARLALGSDNVVALPDRSRSIARPGNIWVVRIAALAASSRSSIPISSTASFSITSFKGCLARRIWTKIRKSRWRSWSSSP